MSYRQFQVMWNILPCVFTLTAKYKVPELPYIYNQVLAMNHYDTIVILCLS